MEDSSTMVASYGTLLSLVVYARETRPHQQELLLQPQLQCTQTATKCKSRFLGWSCIECLRLFSGNECHCDGGNTIPLTPKGDCQWATSITSPLISRLKKRLPGTFTWIKWHAFMTSFRVPVSQPKRPMQLRRRNYARAWIQPESFKLLSTLLPIHHFSSEEVG